MLARFRFGGRLGRRGEGLGFVSPCTRLWKRDAAGRISFFYFSMVNRVVGFSTNLSRAGGLLIVKSQGALWGGQAGTHSLEFYRP